MVRSLVALAVMLACGGSLPAEVFRKSPPRQACWAWSQSDPGRKAAMAAVSDLIWKHPTGRIRSMGLGLDSPALSGWKTVVAKLSPDSAPELLAGAHWILAEACWKDGDETGARVAEVEVFRAWRKFAKVDDPALVESVKDRAVGMFRHCTRAIESGTVSGKAEQQVCQGADEIFFWPGLPDHGNALWNDAYVMRMALLRRKEEHAMLAATAGRLATGLEAKLGPLALPGIEAAFEAAVALARLGPSPQLESARSALLARLDRALAVPGLGDADKQALVRKKGELRGMATAAAAAADPAVREKLIERAIARGMSRQQAESAIDAKLGRNR